MDVLSKNNALYFLGTAEDGRRILIKYVHNTVLFDDDRCTAIGKSIDIETLGLMQTQGWMFSMNLIVLAPDKNRPPVVLYNHSARFDYKVLGYMETEVMLNWSIMNYLYAHVYNADYRTLAHVWLWLIRSTGVCPTELYYRLYTDRHFEELMAELFLEVRNASSEVADIFAVMYVMRHYYLAPKTFRHRVSRRDPPDSVYLAPEVARCMGMLVQGIQILLCRARDDLARETATYIHDFVKIHRLFWVEDLISWIDLEEGILRDPKMPGAKRMLLSRLILGEFREMAETGLFFDLKLDVINVSRLMTASGVVWTPMSTRSLLYRGSPGVPVLEARADLSNMTETSSETMDDEVEYSREMYDFAMENIGRVWFDSSHINALPDEDMLFKESKTPKIRMIEQNL
ncbi:MAG: hypothetical protein JSS82_00145 [Bacteroidetes bacterium]|nr:hypothetical protein [Bacteroidota bacterium]